jgi:hypothetical protein
MSNHLKVTEPSFTGIQLPPKSENESTNPFDTFGDEEDQDDGFDDFVEAS